MSSYKIFVTSDHKGAEEDAVREFGSDRVFRIEGAQTHVGHHVHENASDCSLFEKPILDLHFLQNCDMAVVSMFSGFGIFGVLNRKNPLDNFFLFDNSEFHLLNEKNYQEMLSFRI